MWVDLQLGELNLAEAKLAEMLIHQWKILFC